MWAPFIDMMEESRKRIEKARDYNMTVEEVEAMELQGKIKKIESLKMPTGSDIKKYIELRERWRQINETKEYNEWTKTHKKTIEDLFNHLFYILAMEGKHSVILKYDEMGYIKFKDELFIEQFLLRLLRENGYYYSISYFNRKKDSIKIVYRMEDIK